MHPNWTTKFEEGSLPLLKKNEAIERQRRDREAYEKRNAVEPSGLQKAKRAPPLPESF
jgi:predicted glycosyl hydrolase (DUF1957 family)